MRKKNSNMIEKSMKIDNGDRSRPFCSPKHQASIKQDYNTYMKMRKYKSSLEKRQEVLITQRPRDAPPIQTSLKYQYPPIILQQLIKQNDFLIDEIMRYKQQVVGHQQTISRLKRCKSQKCTTMTSQNNITIVDQQNWYASNIVESKLIKEGSPNPIKDLSKRQKRCKDLLEQSQAYINHSRISASYQIQQLNEKLCRLIQSSSFEKDAEKRKKSRLEISNCVKELKQLRKNYERLYH